MLSCKIVAVFVGKCLQKKINADTEAGNASTCFSPVEGSRRKGSLGLQENVLPSNSTSTAVLVPEQGFMGEQGSHNYISGSGSNSFTKVFFSL